jgi:hypothetical protein
MEGPCFQEVAQKKKIGQNIENIHRCVFINNSWYHWPGNFK